MLRSKDDQYLFELIEKLKGLVADLPNDVPALVAQFNPEFNQAVQLIESQVLKLKALSDVR